MDELKRSTATLDGSGKRWWVPRGEDVRLAAQYPSRENAAEWGDEILHLDQLVVEALKESELRKIATARGVIVEDSWRSLRLIEAILIGAGRTPEEAKALVAPLQRMHALRNILTAHTGGSTKRQEQRQAIAEHGTYRAHFERLASGVLYGLTAIVATLDDEPTDS